MVTVFEEEWSKHTKAIYPFGYQPNFLGNPIVKLPFYRRLSHRPYQSRRRALLADPQQSPVKRRLCEAGHHYNRAVP